MHFRRQPIFVQAFHYDLSMRSPEDTTGIGVQLQKLYDDEIDQMGLKVPKGGSVMKVIIPFDFIPPQQNFDISGIMNQIVVIEGFDGKESELPEEAVKKLSRPIIELIETLTYEVTTLVLDKGINLNFVAKSEKAEDVDEVDDSESESE
ncbi:DUF1149 family protein [Xylocopilactobacillus apis]|uniref:DUF1149 domain-containing protein n=1 Tax=Xylocopilactobacillus apis TaxID=2932183 RepID=A0AAU9D5P2_9LACO|nr:DUF1149 family protein [Xylocopilactobacillus apis]BDR56740.1 hypothetical protein KIMC2_13020 [Xylocopilactobacillus apis]